MIRALLELAGATLELAYRKTLALPCTLGRPHVPGEHPFCTRCGAYLDERSGTRADH